MKMKILYLEDDGVMRTRTVQFLEGDGYEVECFRRIDQANEYLEEHKNEVGCIITDLNMDDTWLDEKYQAESDGCLLTGWVWLRHSVFTIDELKSKPCIIYSGYNDELRRKIGRKEWGRSNVNFVDKGGDIHEGYSELIQVVNRVLKK